MHCQHAITLAFGLTIGSLGCGDGVTGDDKKRGVAESPSMSTFDIPARDPGSETVPSWIPTSGLPLPGHGGNRYVKDPTVRPLTTDELMTIAYRYHPQLGNPDNYSIEAFDDAFWNSPEQKALSRVQYEGYQRLVLWQELRDSVARSVPPGYIVAERTYPRYFPTYLIVVDAPREPGSNEDRFLLIYLSYLVPYYFYCELHSRRVHGLIRRDPLLYEVTPVFEEVLAVVEREIAVRYGYWRMAPDIAAIEVPGIHINAFHDWEKRPPTLWDALFSPNRW